MKFSIVTICLIALLLAGLSADVGQAKDRPDVGEPTRRESTRDDLTYVPAEWPDAPDTAAMLRRLVTGTTIVLVLCVCGLFGARRWLRGTPGQTSSGNALRLIETVSLGNRCSIHLIQTGEHRVLVGVDGTGMKSLVPLPASFERALADVESPTLAMVENLDGSELSVA